MVGSSGGAGHEVEEAVTIDLLDSERMYVDLFARTGRWRVQRLPRMVVEEGFRQRAIHKRHRAGGGDVDQCPCSGCVRQRNGFELVLDFTANVDRERLQTATKSMQPATNEDRLEALREEKERLSREKKKKR